MDLKHKSIRVKIRMNHSLNYLYAMSVMAKT